MSQFGTPGSSRSTQTSGSSNVYTVLALIAALVIVAGIVYLAIKGNQLTGQGNPFNVIPQSTTSPR
ncbi:MAG: hypothetical protein WD042_16150 [Phycisphaeraceae bacterium]